MSENTGSVARGWWSLATLSGALFVLLCSVAPSSAAIVREPYLQIVTHTSVTVVWRTDLSSADNSRVQYGTVAGTLNQTATGTAVTRSGLNVKDHIVTITGLNSATKYFYNIGTTTDGVQGGGTAQHFFVTAPAVGSSTPLRAWVLGDSGDAGIDQQLVRDTMLSETALNPPSPNIILHMGDIAYESGTDLEFTNNHFAIYQDILRQTPLWPTLGNHEALSVNTAFGIGPYYEAHVLPANAQAGGVASGTEAYYAFDYANVHFIVLDSMDSSRAPDSPMLSWLQNDLASTGQAWVIAFWHHPPYSKGGHNSDSAADSGGRMVDMRETVLPILEAGGVDVVLAGHSHAYERSYLLDGAYGYGTSPSFATPSFNTLLADGHILDAGDGDPSGNGPYVKNSGGTSNNGAVYVVAGHGGAGLSTNPPGNHPVMKVFELAFGSVMLDINGSGLTMRNVRSGGAITDTVAIQKTPAGTNLAPNGVINTPSGAQTIQVGQALTFTGTGTDPEPNLPLTHRWIFGTGSGIPDATAEDPGTITFNTAGVFTVTYTVTDALGLADPTPASVQVTVNSGSPPPSLIISNLTVASGKTYIVPTSGLQTGGIVYIDRSYTFSTVPALVQGETYIQTANDDKNATTTNFLSFTVNQPATVYVAYDSRISPKPAWLGAFSDTGQNLVTSDTTLRVFARNYSTGTVTLGGNTGGFSMYSVVVQPQDGGSSNQAPNGVINTPSGAQTIQVGQALTFTGTGTDPEPNLPLTHRWIFGTGSGIPDATAEDPGTITFNTAGMFTVTYTVTDALGLADPTPASVQVTVNSGSPPPSLIISNLTVASGKTYIVPTSGLQTGGIVYIDRSYTFTTVPALVQGETYIQTANDDKNATTTNFLSFDVNQPATVYVGHDDRISPKPAWLGAFTDTGENLVTTDTTLSLYAQNFSAGTITLGGNTGGFSMYSVVVQPQDGGTSDTTPPSVSLTAPANGATVSGTITVSATADDNIGVAGVQFRLNGTTLGAEDTSAPFSIAWNTTTVANGSHTLAATARDAAGNTTSSSPITVTVSNTTSPPSSLTISNLTVASGKSYVVASNLQPGATVYIDRAYTFTTVPASVQGAAYIRTANDDRAATTTNFLRFDVNQPVTVSVGHDVRISPKPAWLGAFTDTGQNLVTSDTTLRVFARNFSTGTVTLGGNTSGGGFSMYSVVIKPQEGSNPPPSGGFTAYNDLAWGTGQLTSNITRITSPTGGSGLPSSGQLLDYATGTPTPVILTVTGGHFIGDTHAGQGANPTSGDAFTLFNGKVSGQGVISYINDVNNSLVLTFSGLNSSKRYDLTFFAHRNDHSWNRASLVTISGQDAFTNTSSVANDNPSETGGVIFSGSTDTSTRLPADNDNGYVARFSNIDPGSDGTVVLTISFDGIVSEQFEGKYGSAIRLVEEQ